MIKFLAHDTVNDIALIQTSFCYNVRYGLEVTKSETLQAAVAKFNHCQMHALAVELEQDSRG